MKLLPVLIALLYANITCSQITVINTGTSEDLYSISKIGKNYLINGSESYIGRCLGECATIQTLVVPPLPNSNYAFTIVRPDSNIIYLNANSFSDLNLILWKSTDGGYNWTKKFDTVNPSMYQGALTFFDTTNGICFVDNWKTIKTNNGLSTYSFGTWNNYGPIIAESYGDSTVIVGNCSGGCGGQISIDRGQTWKGSFGLGTHVPKDFDFLNRDTIFSITSVSSGMAYFYRTFNGGVNWDSKVFTGTTTGSPPDDQPNSLCVKQQKEIYLTARNDAASGYKGYGVILKTQDYGATWMKYVTPFKANLNSMKFMNDSTALVCGDSGLLFKWNAKRTIFTGIDDKSLDMSFTNVHPNPFSGGFTLNLNTTNFKPINLSVFNLIGQLVHKQEGYGSNIEIRLPGLPKGIYILRIQQDSQVKNMRIVKE